MSNNLVFGVTSSGAWGIFQSASHSDSAEVAEARGADGTVIEMKAYSVSNEKQFEMLLDSTVTLPKIGESLEVGVAPDDWTGIITSVSLTETNTDFQKVSITAQLKDAAALQPVSYV
jgi:hypothetical protein